MTAPVRVSLDASAIPDPAGGAGRYVLALAEALERRDDVEVTVVARAGDGARWPRLVVAAAPAPRPVRLVWEQAGLPLLLRRLRVDVHHGPHYTMPVAAGRPTVVTIHDLSFFTHPEWHDRAKVAFFTTAIRLAARRASALVAVSATTAELLTELVEPRAPVHVVPHGVDHLRFRPDPPAAVGEGGDEDLAALARLGVRAPYVAFLGTLEPRKDVPTLVRAFDRIAGGRADLTLVLAGAPGWGTAAVDAAVAGASHRDRIHRLGYVAEDAIPALLRGAAVVAYPSLEEGFGLPVLEALACGAPVVTTCGTVMEEVAAGAAVLCRPADASSLADALEEALTPDDRRRRLGSEVAARSTWEASAAAHVDVYRSAAATGG
ncbi:MAG TPA: glycosyltransferase family 1 protein [Acidimicrobiales bacterium]|nr:glycosyltransferase family 1 protein [Acidimicrobiales bacterium]